MTRIYISGLPSAPTSRPFSSPCWPPPPARYVPHVPQQTMKLSTIAILFPALAAARIGGPCDDIWQKNHACICLKTKECREKWDGTVIQGDPGAWSCPDDPADVKGCLIDHCDGFFTGCRWTSHCKHLGPSKCTQSPRGFPVHPSDADSGSGASWLTVALLLQRIAVPGVTASAAAIWILDPVDGGEGLFARLETAADGGLSWLRWPRLRACWR